MNRLVLVMAFLAGDPALAFCKGRNGPRTPAAASTAKPAPPPDNPPAGQCSAIQDGLKVCSTIDGRGSFDVVTSPPALVLVSFEDQVTWVNPPPTQYFRADIRNNTVTIEPRQNSFPDPTPVVITAGDTVVTLKLRPAGRSGMVDTQVIVKDPGRRVRDSEIDQRVSEQIAPKLAELAERERQLEARAEVRVEGIMLEELARRGAEVLDAGGSSAARNDAFIVLRLRGRIRVGDRRYVLVTLENRSNRPFELTRARLWMSDGGAEHEVVTESKFVAAIVRSGEESRGAILIPPGRRTSSTTRVRVRVEDSDSRRSVELGGISMP